MVDKSNNEALIDLVAAVVDDVLTTKIQNQVCINPGGGSGEL